MSSGPGQCELRFDAFTVNLTTRTLLKDGKIVDIEPKPFQMLELLLREAGRVISPSEFKARLWSDVTVEVSQNINTQIGKLRRALGESAEHAFYILTKRKEGYYFNPEVRIEIAEEVEPRSAAPETTTETIDRSSVGKGRRPLAYIIVAITFCIGLGTLLPTQGVPPPRVVSSAPLTHTESAKYAPILSDGVSVYFTEVEFGRYRVAKFRQLSQETSIIDTQVPNPYLCDLSPDRKSMLLRSVVGGFDDYGPLFIQRMDGGPADPLPVTAFDGSWAPNGRTLVYARGPEVSVFNLSTRSSTVIARVDGYAWWPRFRPDGRRLRFTVSDAQSQLTSLWEVRPDGSGLRRLFDQKAPWFHAGCGSWTPDGRYFLFQVGPLASTNLWILDEGYFSFLRKQNPSQLTNGPSFRGAVIGTDSQTVLVRSQMYRGELRRVDLTAGTLGDLPVPGITDVASYSPDGKSMVFCVSDQEHSLWLSKTDGSSLRLLIPPPLESAFPQWSPLGDRIALVTRRPGEVWKLTLISPESGNMQQISLIPANVLHPTWSPDGKQVLFGTIPTINENAYLYTVDLVTRRVSILAGSQGLFTPAWSPNGRYIVALRADSYQLAILDRTTGAWDVIPGQKFGYPVWSSDSKSIYSFHNDSDGPRFYQIDVSTKTPKEILCLRGFHLLERWMGLHPDGSLLVARNIGIQELYALKLDQPLIQKTK